MVLVRYCAYFPHFSIVGCFSKLSIETLGLSGQNVSTDKEHFFSYSQDALSLSCDYEYFNKYCLLGAKFGSAMFRLWAVFFFRNVREIL